MFYPSFYRVAKLFALGGLVLSIWSFAPGLQGSVFLNGVSELFLQEKDEVFEEVCEDQSCGISSSGELSGEPFPFVTSSQSLFGNLSNCFSGFSLSNQSESVPANYMNEVGMPNYVKNTYWFNDCELVGFDMSVSAEQSLKSWIELLEKKKWVRIESGVDSVITFVKDEGDYRWLFVQAVNSGEGSLVSVSYQRLGLEG